MKFSTMLVCAAIALASAAAGIREAAAEGADAPRQGREESRTILNEGLDALYAVQPKARDEVRRSFGYAVFSTAAGGKGLIYETVGRRQTMMRMDGGLQGGGDVVQVWVFRDREAWRRFIVHGYTIPAGTTLPSDTDDNAYSPPGATAVVDDATVYNLVDGKLVSTVTMAATHYGRVEKID